MSECQFLGLERKKKRCITEAETEKREASCPPWSFYSCWPWLWCLIMMWLWLNGPWDCNVVREWKGNCLFSTIFILSSFTLPPNMTVCGFSPSVPRMNVVVKALLELSGWHCFTDSTFKTVDTVYFHEVFHSDELRQHFITKVVLLHVYVNELNWYEV